MDCKRDFTVIQIERLLLPAKWKKIGRYLKQSNSLLVHDKATFKGILHYMSCSIGLVRSDKIIRVIPSLEFRNRSV